MFTKLMQLIVADFLLMIAAECYAQYNPILMIGTNRPNSHYEVLPQDVRSKCTRAIGPYKTDPFVVYAHIRKSSYEYYAEWGTNKNRKDDEYDQGATLLEIHGRECKSWELEGTLMAVPPRNGYHGSTSEARLPGDDSPTEDSPLVRHFVFRSAEEESLLREFIRDTIYRAIKTYGGDTPFRAVACKPQEELTDSGFIVVLQELKSYCSRAPGK
jgi:hypothetical protein